MSDLGAGGTGWPSSDGADEVAAVDGRAVRQAIPGRPDRGRG